jgi:hypothetical protein
VNFARVVRQSSTAGDADLRVSRSRSDPADTAPDRERSSKPKFAVMHDTALVKPTDKRLIWARLALDDRARLLRHLNPSYGWLRWSKLA